MRYGGKDRRTLNILRILRECSYGSDHCRSLSFCNSMIRGVVSWRDVFAMFVFSSAAKGSSSLSIAFGSDTRQYLLAPSNYEDRETDGHTSYYDLPFFLLSDGLPLSSFCNNVVCILRIRSYLNNLSACRVSHPKRKYWCAKVIANFLLFGVESDTLSNMRIAMSAPYVEGHFEADGKLATFHTRRRFAMDLVAGCESLLVGRDISTHIKTIFPIRKRLSRKLKSIPLHYGGTCVRGSVVEEKILLGGLGDDVEVRLKLRLKQIGLIR